MTHSAVNITTVEDDSATIVVSDNSYIKNAKEVLISFSSNSRIGQIHIIRSISGFQCGISAYLTETPSYLVVYARCNFDTGNIQIGCSANSWGVSRIPVKIDANTVRYR